MSYKIKMLVLGSVSTNCYLLYDDSTKEAVIFDPADKAERIIDTIKSLQLKPMACLLTHGHFDHTLAGKKIRETYQIPIYAHREELEVAKDPQMNLSMAWDSAYSLEADVAVEDGEELEISGFRFRVIHTPGHTKGSCCYYLEEKGVLFSGDTLFACSIGRTDFPTGSGATLIRSIKNKLAVLPDETIVFPGHGEQTTIGYEKQNNPFM